MSAQTGKMRGYVRKLRLLIETSRPKFYFFPIYFYISAFVILGSGFTLPVVVQTVSLSFPLLLFINGVNDLYDVEADKMDDLRKEGETIKEKFEDLFVFKTLVVLSPIFIVSVSFVFNLWNTLFVTLVLFLGYAYSAPPIRLKERPPLDSISNGVIAVLLPFFLGASTFMNPLDVSLRTTAEALVLTFGISAGHAYYAAIDYEPDKKAGLTTIATKYGKKVCVVASIVAVLLNYVTFRPKLGVYFDLVVLYMVVVLLTVLRNPDPKYMLRAANVMYPAFILAVILFLILDAGIFDLTVFM